MYIHDTIIPNIVELMSNGITKALLIENYGLTDLCQEIAGEWLIKLGFKCDYFVNNEYVGGQKKKDTIWYRWKFIYFYLLIE